MGKLLSQIMCSRNNPDLLEGLQGFQFPAVLEHTCGFHDMGLCRVSEAFFRTPQFKLLIPTNILKKCTVRNTLFCYVGITVCLQERPVLQGSRWLRTPEESRLGTEGLQVREGPKNSEIH